MHRIQLPNGYSTYFVCKWKLCEECPKAPQRFDWNWMRWKKIYIFKHIHVKQIIGTFTTYATPDDTIFAQQKMWIENYETRINTPFDGSWQNLWQRNCTNMYLFYCHVKRTWTMFFRVCVCYRDGFGGRFLRAFILPWFNDRKISAVAFPQLNRLSRLAPNSTSTTEVDTSCVLPYVARAYLRPVNDKMKLYTVTCMQHICAGNFFSLGFSPHTTTFFGRLHLNSSWFS